MADGTQVLTSVTIISSLLGYQALSLTEFTTSAVSLIAAGSKVEIGGAFFTFGTDCTPNASSWTAVTTATTAYLQLTPAGTAGTMTVSASWLTSGTVWSTSKQGWYASAASISRVVASAYKVGPTSYDDKSVLIPQQKRNTLSLSSVRHPGAQIYTNIVGPATMASGISNITVAHGISNARTDHRIISAIAQADSATYTRFSVNADPGPSEEVSSLLYNDTNFYITRDVTTTIGSFYITYQYV